MRRWFEVENARLGRAHNRSLKPRREPTIGPVAHALQRMPAGIGQDDVGGQTLVFRAEAVSEPRAERGTPRLRFPGIHEPDGRLMTVDVRVHGANERYVIHDAGEVGEELGDIHSALAMLLKFPRT